MNLRSFLCFLATTSIPKKNMVVTQNSIPSFPPRVGYSLSNGLGLDINCKTGESIHELQKKFPHLTFIGTEKDEKKVRIAREKHSDYHFLNMDIEKKEVPLVDQFEIIQISDYEDFWKIMEKSFSLLQDDGLLIMKYKQKDLIEIKKILKMKKPKKKINEEIFERIYLSDKENEVFFLK